MHSVYYFFSVYISETMRVSWLVVCSKSRGLLELVLCKIIGCRDRPINSFTGNCQASITILLDHFLLLFKLIIESCLPTLSIVIFGLRLCRCLHARMNVFSLILKNFFNILIFFIVSLWLLKVSEVVKTLFKYVKLFGCCSHE